MLLIDFHCAQWKEGRKEEGKKRLPLQDPQFPSQQMSERPTIDKLMQVAMQRKVRRWCEEPLKH